MLCWHSSHFYNRAFRGKITFQSNHTTGLGQRCVDRINNPAICLAANFIQLFAHRIPGCGDAIFVNQASFAQLFHYHWHAARFIKIFGNIGTAWFKIYKIRCVAENVADIVQIEINAGFMSNGGQM